MKLVRYGAPGREKPGMIDKDGRIRDLSKVVPDISGAVLSPASLNKLRKLKPEKLPLVKGKPRIGACVGGVGNFIAIGLNYSDHAAEAGMQIPKEPIIFNKAPSCICGPNDDTMVPKDSTKLDWEVELGIVIGQPRALSLQEQRARRRRRLLPRQRRLRARLPDRARRAVDQGQGLRDLRPARAVARHQGRAQGPAKSRNVARRQRRETPARQYQDHDLRLPAHRLGLLAIFRHGAGRRHHHRHAAGRRDSA